MPGSETRRSSRRANGRPEKAGSAVAHAAAVRPRTSAVDPIAFASAIARAIAKSRKLRDRDVAIGAVLAASLPHVHALAGLVVTVKDGVIASASTEATGLDMAQSERRSLLRIAKQTLTSGKATSRADTIDAAQNRRAGLFATPLLQDEAVVGALAIAMPHIRPADADADAVGGIALLSDCLIDMLQAPTVLTKAKPRSNAIIDRLHRALASHVDGVALFGPDNELITANAAFAAAHGAEASVLKGLTFDEILQQNHDGFGPLLLARDLRDDAASGTELALAANGDWLRIARQRTSSGDTLIIQSPAGGEIIVASKARHRLRAVEAEAEQQRIAWDALPLGAIICTKTGRVADCNKTAAELLGVECADLKGQRLGRLGKLDIGDGADTWRLVGRARSGGAKLAARARPFGKDQVLVLLSKIDDFPGHIAAPEAPPAEKTERSRTEAEAAIRALGELGHELRTPLNAVLGFTDVLLAKSFGPINTRQDEYLQDVAVAGRHMLEMVDHLLDHARLTSGHYKIEPVWRSADETLNEAAAFMQPIAEKAGIALTSHDAPALELFIDRHAFFQILVNLMANAIKFTPEGGRVSVSVQEDVNAVKFQVIDTGSGIANDMLALVMEPFTQARKTGGNALKGAGLGLAIAKSLTELHGGQLHIASKEGSGTTATVLLPMSRTRVLE